jgi:hypothetical protein
MYTKRVHRVLHLGRSRAGKFAATLAVMALVGALEAGVGVAAKDPSRSCSVQPATSQPFLHPWNDSHQYFLAPGGDMESDFSDAGWVLSGDAGLLSSSSESFRVTGNPNDSQSLGLPAGSSALTPSICVTIHDPALRFFAMNTGKKDAVLQVSSLFEGNDGKLHTHDLGDVHAGSDWTLTNPIKFKDSIQPGPDGTGQVAFMFSPKDNKGNWQIDDLYIDPLKSQ